MLTKYSIYFFLAKKDGRDRAPIRMRIRWRGYVVCYNVGISVDVDKWDIDMQRCKRGTSHGRDKIAGTSINRHINAYHDAVVQTFASFEAEGKAPTADEFRKRFMQSDPDQREERTGQPALEILVGEYVKEMQHVRSWSSGTIKSLADTIATIRRYDKTPTPSFTEEWAEGWLTYMIETTGTLNGTIKTRFNMLKSFLRWAGNRLTADGTLNFTPRLRTTARPVIFLTPEELERFAKVDTTETERTGRDIFLLQCYTGLRVSDASSLTWKQITADEIVVTIQKTRKTVKLPISAQAREILDYWRQRTGENGNVFPHQELKEINKNIRTIAKIADIATPVTLPRTSGGNTTEETHPKYEVLTSHCGRKTFVCLMLSLGVSPQIVMKMTGHSSWDAMKPYIDVTDTSKEEAVRKLETLG